MAKKAPARRKLVMCVKVDGYEASLVLRKIYVALPDAFGGRRGWLRVIDESGEDYLFPKSHFTAAKVSGEAKELLQSAA